MKNIYNLLTDAFTESNLDETAFVKKVEGFYKITVSKPDHPGRLFIYMDIYDDTVERIQYVNSLLSPEEFNNLKAALNRNITNPFTELLNSLLLLRA